MSIDRGVIEQQLQALGEGSSWWERRELRDLPTVLHADERILAIARGTLARPATVRRPWLIVVTDQRLVCLRSAGRSGWRQVEAHAHQILRTGLRIGPVRGRVIVVTNDRTYRLRVNRRDAHKLSTALSQLGTPTNVRPGSGPTVVIRRVIDHMLELPAAALEPGKPKPALPAPSPVDDRVDALEQEVEELREHVRFLEQLLQQKHIAAVEEIGSG